MVRYLWILLIMAWPKFSVEAKPAADVKAIESSTMSKEKKELSKRLDASYEGRKEKGQSHKVDELFIEAYMLYDVQTSIFLAQLLDLRLDEKIYFGLLSTFAGLSGLFPILNKWDWITEADGSALINGFFWGEISSFGIASMIYSKDLSGKQRMGLLWASSTVGMAAAWSLTRGLDLSSHTLALFNSGMIWGGFWAYTLGNIFPSLDSDQCPFWMIGLHLGGLSLALLSPYLDFSNVKLRFIDFGGLVGMGSVMMLTFGSYDEFDDPEFQAKLLLGTLLGVTLSAIFIDDPEEEEVSSEIEWGAPMPYVWSDSNEEQGLGIYFFNARF